MNADDLRARIAAAKSATAQLAAVVAEGGRDALVWQQRLRQIAADLNVTDAPERQVLDAARERFDSLYAGGRNFSDFHLWRTDPAERITVNERLSALTEQLSKLLHD